MALATVPLPAPDGPSIAINTAAQDTRLRPLRGLRRGRPGLFPGSGTDPATTEGRKTKAEWPVPVSGRPYNCAVRVALISLLVLVTLLVAGWWALSQSRYGRAMSLLVRLGRVQGPIGTHVGHWQTTTVERRMLSFTARHGVRVARLYTPLRVRTRPLLLTGGVHALGIDEPRLIAFAEQLARTGTPVITPSLPDLKEYLVTTRLTDDIEDAAGAMLDSPEVPHARDRRIGLLGISFAGGLSVIAAGRDTLRDRVAFVFSMGGHARLPPVMRYLCTGVQPDGRRHRPHDYGSVILLTNIAEDIVPADQVAPLREAVHQFLHASHVDMFDKAQAAIEFRKALEMERRLPVEAQDFMHLVNTRDVPGLGARLLPHLDRWGQEDALSPTRSPAPTAPVFVMHAEGDDVIPDSEAPALAAYLQSQGTPVRVHVTPMINHAEVKRAPSIGELVTLVRLWAELPW
jgi:acetyl esterase/lipase